MLEITRTLLAKRLRHLDSELEVLDSKPYRGNFLLFAFCYVHTNVNLYIQCMYLVYISYEQDLNKYVHEHVCKYNM